MLTSLLWLLMSTFVKNHRWHPRLWNCLINCQKNRRWRFYRFMHIPPRKHESVQKRNGCCWSGMVVWNPIRMAFTLFVKTHRICIAFLFASHFLHFFSFLHLLHFSDRYFTTHAPKRCEKCEIYAQKMRTNAKKVQNAKKCEMQEIKICIGLHCTDMIKNIRIFALFCIALPSLLLISERKPEMHVCMLPESSTKPDRHHHSSSDTTIRRRVLSTSHNQPAAQDVPSSSCCAPPAYVWYPLTVCLWCNPRAGFCTDRILFSGSFLVEHGISTHRHRPWRFAPAAAVVVVWAIYRARSSHLYRRRVSYLMEMKRTWREWD
jgi:hypothetical protein